MFQIIAVNICLIAGNDFFNKTEVQFWDDGNTVVKLNNNDTKQNKETHEINSSGTGANQPIDDLLENPTEQNALRYLLWQQQRLNKVSKAVKMLKRVREKVIASKTGKHGDGKKTFTIKNVK